MIHFVSFLTRTFFNFFGPLCVYCKFLFKFLKELYVRPYEWYQNKVNRTLCCVGIFTWCSVLCLPYQKSLRWGTPRKMISTHIMMHAWFLRKISFVKLFYWEKIANFWRMFKIGPYYMIDIGILYIYSLNNFSPS